MAKEAISRRFAERSLAGIDDIGNEERVLVWIEFKPDAIWAVGRVVNGHLRPSDAPRDEDYVFEGFELNDAIAEANGALADDLRVSSEEGIEQEVALFTREEILERLEHWFFHHGDGQGAGS